MGNKENGIKQIKTKNQGKQTDRLNNTQEQIEEKKIWGTKEIVKKEPQVI
jgi:hypothetical protein